MFQHLIHAERQTQRVRRTISISSISPLYLRTYKIFTSEVDRHESRISETLHLFCTFALQLLVSSGRLDQQSARVGFISFRYSVSVHWLSNFSRSLVCLLTTANTLHLINYALDRYQ